MSVGRMPGQVFIDGKPVGVASSLVFDEPFGARLAKPLDVAALSMRAISMKLEMSAESLRAFRTMLAKLQRMALLRAQLERKGRPGWKHMRVRG